MALEEEFPIPAAEAANLRWTARLTANVERAGSRFVIWCRAHPRILAALGLTMLSGLFIVVYTWMPWWLDGSLLRQLAPKDRASQLGSDRDEVLKIVAGVGGVVALVYTARRHTIDRRTLESTQRALNLDPPGGF